MKKILLLVGLVMVTTTINAQSLSVVAGASVSSVLYRMGAGGTQLEKDYQAIAGFHGGLAFDYLLKKRRNKELVIETGLLFDTKGSKHAYITLELDFSRITRLYYVDVPVYLKYRYRFRSLHKLYVGAGPYFGLGLSGQAKQKRVVDGEVFQESTTIKWGSDTNKHDYSRPDYGLSVKGGVFFPGGLDMSMSYDLGLRNISSMGNSVSIKNRAFRISLAYAFSL